MNKATYQAVPVSTNGDTRFVIQRRLDGQVSYLAQVMNTKRIAEYEYPLAEENVKVLEAYGKCRCLVPDVWLPWHSAHLPMRPVAAMLHHTAPL